MQHAVKFNIKVSWEGGGIAVATILALVSAAYTIVVRDTDSMNFTAFAAWRIHIFHRECRIGWNTKIALEVKDHGQMSPQSSQF